MARSLSKVLCACGLDCQELPVEGLTSSTAPPDPEAVRLLAAAQERSTAIVVMPGTVAAGAAAIGLIHRLRSELLWEGKLIVLARDHASATSIETTSLLPNSRDTALLGATKGHCVLSCPLLLPQLLEALDRVPPLQIEGWWQLLQLSELASLRSTARRGRRQLEAGDLFRARSACCELAERIGILGPRQLLLDHQEARALAEILRVFSAPEGVDLASCRTLLRLVDHSPLMKGQDP